MNLVRMVSIIFMSIIFLFLGSICFADEPVQTINVKSLAFKPVVDGKSDEWSEITQVKVLLDGKYGINSVNLRGGIYEDEVFFVFIWADDHEDAIHKPFVWDEFLEKYIVGPQREDRFSINFAMNGDFTSDWYSGKTFTADMWHWKAFRTNSIGLAHDKMTYITDQKPTGMAYEATSHDGVKIYIQRPADNGSKLYKTTRYALKKDSIMPKYILTKKPSGSIADVKAKGIWANGEWTLEIKRKLNTKNIDDVVFAKGKKIKGAIAVFNAKGDDKHDISKTLLFNF